MYLTIFTKKQLQYVEQQRMRIWASTFSYGAANQNGALETFLKILLCSKINKKESNVRSRSEVNKCNLK